MNKWYPSFLKHSFNGNCNINDTFRCALLKGYDYDSSNESFSDIIQFEIDGSANYQVGGEIISPIISTDNIVNSWSWSQLSWTGLDDEITSAVIYRVGNDLTDSYLVYFIDLRMLSNPTNNLTIFSDENLPSTSGSIFANISEMSFNTTYTAAASGNQITPTLRITPIIDNGKGGFFISGNFTSVTTRKGTFQRVYICEIDYNGDVTEFDAISSNSQDRTINVMSLQKSEHGDFLYVGGNTQRQFNLSNTGRPFVVKTGPSSTSIRYGAFRISLATGYADAWAPATSIPHLTTTTSCHVNAMVFDPPLGRVYIGGNIVSGISFGGSSGRSHLIRLTASPLSTSSSVQTAFAPNPNTIVTSLAFDKDENCLYAGGNFITLNPNGTGDITRNRCVKLDLGSSGQASVLPWDPGFSSAPLQIELTPKFVYASGGFTSAGGATVSGIVRLLRDVDINNADLTWLPQSTSNMIVRKFVRDNGFIYIIGTISNIDGETINNIARLREFPDSLLTNPILDTSWNISENRGIYNVGCDILSYHDMIITSQGTGNPTSELNDFVFTKSSDDRIIFFSKSHPPNKSLINKVN